MSDRPTPVSPPLAVIGFGEVSTTDPAEFSRNGPSFFADPVAWLVTAAVEQALGRCREDVLTVSDNIGVLVVSEVCTLETMRSIARAATRGRISPLRFAGANPGSLASVACIRWGFRGPTLTLSMSHAAGVEPAVIVAGSWLHSGQAGYVVLGSHYLHNGKLHIARCVIIRGTSDTDSDDAEHISSLLTQPVMTFKSPKP